MKRKQFISIASMAVAGAPIVGREDYTLNEHQQPLKNEQLKGKVALVTGAARGIGLATAKELASMGAYIALLDIADEKGAGMAIDGYHLSSQTQLNKAVQTITSFGVKAMGLKTDVRSLPQMKESSHLAAKELGGIDIVVANAGIVAWSRIEDATEKQWKDVVDVNLHGVANTVWATLPYLKKSSHARIITLSSIGGRMGVVGNGAYSPTKWAVIGLTKSLALELGKYHITVNAVAPTAVNTPMYRSQGQIKSTYMQSENDQDKAMIGYHSLPTPALNPEDIAQAIGFLASDKAKYISGMVMDVAAGGNAHYSA